MRLRQDPQRLRKREGCESRVWYLEIKRKYIFQYADEIKIDENYGDIESVIIIDRSIDFLTPLLKQIVYEGMIDETYGLNGGIVKIPSSKFE